MIQEKHYPVLYKEVEKFLLTKEKIRVFVDCTVGVASHLLYFLNRLDSECVIIGLDKDEDSLRIARQRIKKTNRHVRLYKEDFRNLDRIINGLGIKKVDVFFFDLGVSLFQLTSAHRGFSLFQEGPLDMRMDRHSFLSAYDLVNHLSENELYLIFRRFGEERFSRRIAHYIIEKRKDNPIVTTFQLRDLIIKAIPPSKVNSTSVHPATRVFQALRIAVNRELDAIEQALNKAVNFLAPQGRIGVISFHSLEDRIVKHYFRNCVSEGILQLITKKPVVPSWEEIKENRASRSAKLRVAQKY